MNPIHVATTLFEDGWNGQDFAQVRQLLADKVPLHIGSDTSITNAAELENIVATWHTAFPDFRFEIHSITADDHTAAVRATLHGTPTTSPLSHAFGTSITATSSNGKVVIIASRSPNRCLIPCSM